MFDIVEDNGDDLSAMMGCFISKINYKVAILLYLAFLFINSPISIRIMEKNNLTCGNEITNKGYLLQGLILAILYILFDLLIQSDII